MSVFLKIRRITTRIWKWLNPILYLLTFVVFWMVFSLPPLIGNHPQDFQAVGSIVVAFAIFSLSRTRSSYEAAYRDWTTRRFASHVNHIKEHLHVVDERMGYSVDLIVFHLAQACKKQNIDHPWKLNTTKEIEAMTKRLNEGLSKEIPFPEFEDAISQANDTEHKFRGFEKKFMPWMKLVWRLEVSLLILGTLQWGYGDRFVTALFDGDFDVISLRSLYSLFN